uniref:Uncharacterized protein n=1 Tax=Octopus bimaculoides TaxID=37653 RepID=A0A0L8H540_OCTBM
MHHALNTRYIKPQQHKKYYTRCIMPSIPNKLHPQYKTHYPSAQDTLSPQHKVYSDLNILPLNGLIFRGHLF